MKPQPLTPVTAKGAPPIVVISTTGDPATPYAGGVAVAKTLDSGVLVTNEGDGHTVVADGKPCIDDSVTAYLAGGTTRSPRTARPASDPASAGRRVLAQVGGGAGQEGVDVGGLVGGRPSPNHAGA